MKFDLECDAMKEEFEAVPLHWFFFSCVASSDNVYIDRKLNNLLSQNSTLTVCSLISSEGVGSSLRHVAHHRSDTDRDTLNS